MWILCNPFTLNSQSRWNLGNLEALFLFLNGQSIMFNNLVAFFLIHLRDSGSNIDAYLLKRTHLLYLLPFSLFKTNCLLGRSTPILYPLTLHLLSIFTIMLHYLTTCGLLIKPFNTHFRQAWYWLLHVFLSKFFRPIWTSSSWTIWVRIVSFSRLRPLFWSRFLKTTLI